MSGKKKVTSISNCEACGYFFLIKDEKRHHDFCKKSLEEWEISLVRNRIAMKGFITVIERMNDYLPPDGIGWTKTNSILISPQTMELLGALPRQPVKLTTRDRTIIGTIWPCKELGVMKIGFASKDIKIDAFATMELIWEFKKVKRLQIRVPDQYRSDIALREFLEMYLSHSYVVPDIPINVRYYGNSIELMPELPLEDSINNMSLCEGEIPSTPVLYVESDCTLCFDGVDSSTPPGSAIEPVFTQIGGMGEVKQILMDNIIKPFRISRTACSVLMWGLPGSGKTLLLKQLAQILGNCAYYFESLEDFHERNTLIAPESIVILDIPLLEKDHKGYPAINRLLRNGKVAAVVLAIQQAEDLELSVRVRFPIEVEIPVPIESDRLEILSILLQQPVDGAMRELARRTHGFTGSDLNSVVVASRFAKGSDISEKLENARKRVRPTGIRQFILEVPDVKWSDIGGNEELKFEIQQAVIWPQQHPEVFERFGIDPPAGILLYGPPGCSKTLVARALANDKWVGDSEKAIRELFARARQVAPTIVFFDEIDAVGASRGSEKSSGVSDRVLAQLLTELDGLEKASGVILLAATNRPDQLDSALLRPGRLDRSIHVGLPTPSTRVSILNMRMRKMKLNDDVDIEMVVKKTEGYSGAELVALCRHAALVAMREDINAVNVCWSHFEEAFKAIVPRTEKYLLDIYEQFQEGCFSN
ncbi:unnamed protein product [Auanema sp. JU1783]|nr:unnamed protein product [Auanema sp. JU1783]